MLKKLFNKKLITLGFTLFVWTFFCFISLSAFVTSAISYYRAKNSYYNQRKKIALDRRIEFKHLKQKIGKINSKINNYVEPLSGISQDAILRKILHLIFLNNLRVCEFRPDYIVNRDFYKKGYIRLEFIGSYYDICSFFLKIENLVIPINIKSCRILNQKDELKCKCYFKYYMVNQ